MSLPDLTVADADVSLIKQWLDDNCAEVFKKLLEKHSIKYEGEIDVEQYRKIYRCALMTYFAGNNFKTPEQAKKMSEYIYTVLSIDVEEALRTGYTFQELHLANELLRTLGLAGHLEYVVNHKIMVRDMYSLMRSLGAINALEEVDVMLHDDTKFLPYVALGYLCQFGHGRTTIVKLEDVMLNNYWLSACRFHQLSEDHHPEYHVNKGTPMFEQHLEHAVLDGAAVSIRFDPCHQIYMLEEAFFGHKLFRYGEWKADVKDVLIRFLSAFYKALGTTSMKLLLYFGSVRVVAVPDRLDDDDERYATGLASLDDSAFHD